MLGKKDKVYLLGSRMRGNRGGFLVEVSVLEMAEGSDGPGSEI